MFQRQNSQILGATVENLVAFWRLGFLHLRVIGNRNLF